MRLVWTNKEADIMQAKDQRLGCTAQESDNVPRSCSEGRAEHSSGKASKLATAAANIHPWVASIFDRDRRIV